jgi:hypothetical protein
MAETVPVDTVLTLLHGAGFAAIAGSGCDPTNPSIAGWSVIVAIPV